jgi:hypothetical protein
MGLALTNKTIDKFLGFLIRLDNRSKKKLIMKLAESIEPGEEEKFNLNDFYGTWEDKRDSDEIINEIRKSRVEKNGGRAQF